MYSNVTNLWLGKGRVTQNPLNFYENVLLECTFKTSCLTLFLLNLSVKKETNFCTTDLGWWLICISWQVYLIGSSPVICPREPSTLHMRSHSSYHVCPSLPAALAGGNGNLADKIPALWELCIPWHWLLWQEGICNTPVLLAACASGGPGKALIPGRMNFCRPGALWGTKPGGKQQQSLLLLHGTTRQAGPASTVPAQVSNTAPECSEGMTGVWKAKVFCCETAFLKW